MRIPKILAIIGLAAIILGVALAVVPTTTEVWTPESGTLVKEVASVHPQSDYYPLALAPYIPQESRNLVVNGTVIELKGRTFDFYIFNRVNYESWKAEAPYEAYLQAENVSSHSFSSSATREDVSEGLRFVVMNIYAKEHVDELWFEKIFTVHEFRDYYYMPYIYPRINMKKLDMIINGTAEELTGQKFNLIVLDDENCDLWKAGQPYDALYEVREVTACSFSFPLTPDRVKEGICPIVERVEPGTKVNVRISAYMSYMKPTEISVRYDVAVAWEEKSYAHVLGGLLLGGGLLVLGVIFMIAAAVVKYVSRP